MPGLKLSLNYQYQRGLSNSESHNAEQSYYTRNMINTYSTINPLTGLVGSPIAAGAIVALGSQNYQSQHGRAQLDFLKQVGHSELSLLAGAEIKDYSSTQQNQTYFGYDEATGINANALISANTLYTNFYSGARETVVTSPRQSALYDRFLSYFAQGSYRYLNRYVLSASVRRDESSLFGVKANQQGVPLWSVGARYEISKAPFYQLSWLPMLAIKASYGYNGNVDKSTSAYLTSSPFTLNPWGYTYAQIINPPNPSLRWERVQHVNMGVDFASKDNFFSGSIEYFVKHGQDLIGQSPIVPQTGITLFRAMPPVPRPMV